MDDEEETYRLWKIRKTIMQVSAVRAGLAAPGEPDTQRSGGRTMSAKAANGNQPPRPPPERVEWRSWTKAGPGAASRVSAGRRDPTDQRPSRESEVLESGLSA